MLDIKFLEDLNKKVKYLNNERQKLIGKRDAAKEAFEKALKEYNDKYGLSLQESDLEEELKKVELELQQQANYLVSKIQEIESKLTGSTGQLQTQVQVQQVQGLGNGYTINGLQSQGVFQQSAVMPSQPLSNGQLQGVFQTVDKTQEGNNTNIQQVQWGSSGVGTQQNDSGKPFIF